MMAPWSTQAGIITVSNPGPCPTQFVKVSHNHTGDHHPFLLTMKSHIELIPSRWLSVETGGFKVDPTKQ